MTAPVVIVGAGGFAREVLDVIEAMNAVSPQYEVLGFVADGHADTELLEHRGYRVLGPVGSVLSMDVSYVIGIGNGAARRRIDGMLSAPQRPCPVLIHPSATLGALVSIGPGSVLCAGARVTTNVTLGRHVHLNLNSTVGHDATLEDCVTINPGATISGNVFISAESTVGTGAAIIQQCRIGTGVTVGAGASVIRDVADNLTVVGVPARPIGAPTS